MAYFIFTLSVDTKKGNSSLDQETLFSVQEPIVGKRQIISNGFDAVSAWVHAQE